MTVATTLTPIDGAEAKKILKKQMDERIDRIPLLNQGNAFKQITLGFELVFTAFPADCPVPTAEWEILAGLSEGDDLSFDKDKEKIQQLIKKRSELIDNLTRIEKFLAKYSPTDVIKVIDSDNGTPDELRERHNLKIPVVATSMTGKKTEMRIPPSQLRSSNVAKKG